MVTFHSLSLLSILCSLFSVCYGQANYGTLPQLGYGGAQSAMYPGQSMQLPVNQFPGSQWQQPQPQLYGQASVPASSFAPMTGAGQFGTATPGMFGQTAPTFQSNPMGGQMGMPSMGGFPQTFGIGARQLQTAPEQSAATAGNQMPQVSAQPETAASQSQAIPMILTPQGGVSNMGGGYSPYGSNSPYGSMPMSTGTQGFMPNQMQSAYPYSTMNG